MLVAVIIIRQEGRGFDAVALFSWAIYTLSILRVNGDKCKSNSGMTILAGQRLYQPGGVGVVNQQSGEYEAGL